MDDKIFTEPTVTLVLEHNELHFIQASVGAAFASSSKDLEALADAINKIRLGAEYAGGEGLRKLQAKLHNAHEDIVARDPDFQLRFDAKTANVAEAVVEAVPPVEGDPSLN